MSKYLHKELRPRQPRPVSRGSHCLFHEVHLSKKAKGKNFANDDCKFIGHIWNFFMTQLLLRSRSLLTRADCCYIIYDYWVSYKPWTKLFSIVWLRVIYVIHRKKHTGSRRNITKTVFN